MSAAADRPALAAVMLAGDASGWIEAALRAAAAALAPGDELAVIALAQSEAPAALVRRFAEIRAGRPGPRITLTALPPTPAAAALRLGVGTTAAPHLIRLTAADMLRAEGVAALRRALAADPPAVLAAEERWWVEPGLVLPPGALPGPGSLVLRRDLAAAQGWPDDSPAAVWTRRADLRRIGAPDIAVPLLRAAAAAAADLPAAVADPALAAALVRAALVLPPHAPGLPAQARPMLRALPRGPRRALFADPVQGPLLAALAWGGRRAERAWTLERLAAALDLAAALAARLAGLRAARDALLPDVDELIRAHERLAAEIAAGRAGL